MTDSKLQQALPPPPTAAGQRDTPTQRNFLLAAFSLGHLANDWAAGSIWLIAPAVAASMGLGAPEVGILLALHGIGAAFGYLPAGLIADRLSHRGPLLVLSFLWVVIGYGAASLAPDFWTLTVLLAIAVIGDAAWHPAATGVLMRRFPEQRAQVLGIHAMGGTLGAEVLAPVGVGLLLGFTDWRSALQLSVIPAALMGVAFIVVAQRLGPCPSQPISRGRLIDTLRPWRTGQGSLFIATLVLYNMAYVAILAMVPLFLQKDLHYTPLIAGLVFAAMLILGSLLQPILGHLSDRAGRRPMLLIGTAVGAIFATVAGIITPSLLSVAALVAAAAALTAIRSVVLAAAVELAQEREATNLAMAFTLMDGVGALGAAFAGFAGAVTLSDAFLLAGLFSAGALATSFRLRLDRGGDPLIQEETR